MAETKKKYMEDGVKRFLYFCSLIDCYGLPDNVHIGRSSKTPTRKSMVKMNKKLIDFYQHWETFGKGSAKKRRRPNRGKNDVVSLRLPYMRWEDDGGPSLE